MFERNTFSFDDLVFDMIDRIPEAHFISSTAKFLDPHIAGGQFVAEIEDRLREYGHSDENIKGRVFGYHSNLIELNCAIADHNLIGTYKIGEFLNDDIDMKDLNIVGNPPFNESAKSNNTIAGTSGNTTLYRKFIDKAFSLRGENGTVAFVVQRTGIKYAAEKYGVSYVNLDTSEHWDYAAGYFIANSNDNSHTDVTNNPIINKVYSMTVKRDFRAALGGSYKGYLASGNYSNDPADGVYGLVNTPTEKDGEVFAYIKKGASEAGPKLVFKGLESRKSYTVTDLPTHIGSGCFFRFDSIEEAEAAKLFILNNPVVKYLRSILKEKTAGYVFRYMKDFDLSQIKTGEEIPVEWGLTETDLELL